MEADAQLLGNHTLLNWGALRPQRELTNAYAGPVIDTHYHVFGAEDLPLKQLLIRVRAYLILSRLQSRK